MAAALVHGQFAAEPRGAALLEQLIAIMSPNVKRKARTQVGEARLGTSP